MTASATPQLEIALIGLGSMGFGMAGALVRAGFAVRGCDLRPDVVAAARAAGIAAGTDAAAAARGADAAVIVVVNAAQTEAVLFEANVVAALKPNGVILSCATMSPADARRLAAKTRAAGIDYLDSPISGGAARAAEGALTVLTSGPSAVFAKAKPALEAMAETLYHLDDEIGTAAAFKIVNQLLAGVHIAAACEALAFAKKLNLDLAKVYEVISRSAGSSWMFQNRGAHVIAGDYAPRSAVEIFVKDLGIVEDIARAERFPAPLAGTALQLFLMTASAGMGRDDDASVARLYAKIAGLDLPDNSGKL